MAFLDVAGKILVVNILAYLLVHFGDQQMVVHQDWALKKVWNFATVGGTVESQSLSLMETVEF